MNRTLKVSHLVEAARLTLENIGDAPTRTGLAMPEWLTFQMGEMADEMADLDKDQKQAYSQGMARDIIAMLVFSRSRGLYVEKALGAELVILCEGESTDDLD